MPHAALLASGALEHDRRFALLGEDGQFINGKRFEALHRLRTSIDLADRSVTLNTDDGRTDPDATTFHLDADRPALEAWLQNYLCLNEAARLAENSEAGFPDDVEANGPTIVGTATLEAVAEWFPQLSLAEVRRRFRANLEIGGVAPFWEDRLYAAAGQVVRFQLGEAVLDGVNPCQRCVVPSHDALTGKITPQFAKQFSVHRQRSLPAWAAASRFDHYYRLAVNTRPVRGNARRSIRIGAPLRILGTFPADG
jgi:MOSC domain-containing protein